jgi:lauroyl/myristoyl acyltransferase
MGRELRVRAEELRHKSVAGQSASYRIEVWRLGALGVRLAPSFLCKVACRVGARTYCLLRPQRQEVAVQNFLPVLQGNRAAAERAARALFRNFALKLTDLWRYESGVPTQHWLSEWSGWELIEAAQGAKRGILLVTPHLGNWEFGGPFLVQRGIRPVVLTQPEPGKLTELRQAARAKWGIETLVVGGNDFGFVEVIKRLQDGAAIALLVDRPRPQSTVTIDLFGRPFEASIAAAELARASGCAILPVYIVRKGPGYSAHVLTRIEYDRASLGNREARRQLTQRIVRTFEPVIRQHLDQWYHFVPIWPEAKHP